MNDEILNACQRPENITRVNIFLTYADTTHERLGKKYCDEIAESARTFARISVADWRFDMLAIPAVNVMAAAEARNSAVVVIAMNRGGALPTGVKMWFERWCSTRTSADGILAVILSDSDGTTDGYWTDYPYLEAHARAYGIKFFVRNGSLSPRRETRAGLASARRLKAGELFSMRNLPEVSAIVRSSLPPAIQ
jgi:hypothetical protein